MSRRLRRLVEAPGRFYLWGSGVILLVAVYVISAQVADRSGFANGRLREEVMERWGAPISQSAPSVRFVESGSIFNTLEPLPLDRQRVTLAANMNYRKRGLVYFSGFEFDLRGEYAVTNPRSDEIDVVFVLPVEHERRSMLRDLSFHVNGEPAPIPLTETADKLVWTGRLAAGESATFAIGFRGRGLDSFRYVLDPELPVRNLELTIDIRGGDNYDYESGVVPASSVETDGDHITLGWSFDSLEAGFPFGVILPSEKSFDEVILTLIRRAWTTFALFLFALVGLGVYHRRPLTRVETYLASAGYAFFFVLLPYLAAYMHFYVAYAVTALSMGGLLFYYLARVYPQGAANHVAGTIVALLVVPTFAVVLERHTGLVYALEILAGLAALMVLSMRPAVRAALERLEASFDHPAETEVNHV
jgi:hypothetical protein